MPFHRFSSPIRSPEFKPNLQWWNSQPLTMEALRGKIVLLDFWTYCCINCLHILPDLKKLEHKYHNQLVVIGVHSPKFDNEKIEENVRQAILRYEIEHPVVCDPDFTHWSAFAIRAWPTLVLVDPKGFVVGLFPGEGHFSALDQALSELITTFRNQNALSEAPIKFLPETLSSKRSSPSTLLFPGKIFADPTSQRLYLSDSNHHRILLTDLNGNVVQQIGAGTAGLKDGRYEDAQFQNPQGLYKVGKNLYVADTENHCLRVVDLEAQTVSTLAGTGKQAQAAILPNSNPAFALNSPWDLTFVPPLLYIAMAGSHQIWTYHPQTQKMALFAGSGHEARIDGPVLVSAFAQPSGLTSDGKFLYVADSEVSSIREIRLATPQTVGSPIALDLFVFGDQDGYASERRLQHPLGVAYQKHENCLYIADTYNHKIKRLCLKTGLLETLLGTGKSGTELSPTTELYEPGGLSICDQKLYIADTNNHRILCFDFTTRKTTPITFDSPPTLIPV